MERKTVKVGDYTKTLPNPVAELVHLACQFESKIYLECGTMKVNAKSIMGIMAMTLDAGMEITISAEGKDEDIAVSEMKSYLTC